MEAKNAHRARVRPFRRTRLFWKLFLSFAALSLAAVLLLTWAFSNAYQALIERESDQRLRTAVASLAEFLADDWPPEPDERIQSIVRRLGERTGVRLTLIDLDGRVLADSSQKDLAAVRQLESHHNRSEFMAAVRNGSGAAGRVSATVGERLRYRAVRVDQDDDEAVGVVRAALAAAPIAAEIADLTRWIWTIGALTAAAALAIAYWTAARLTDPLRSLAATAEALAAGDYERRLPVPTRPTDEIDAVAAALNAVSKRLAQRERQLHNTSQTQATVLEGMTESVIAVDRSEKILFANASAVRVFRLDSKLIEGATLLEAVRSHELRAVMQKALRSRRLANIELTWRGKSLRVFDVLATPLPGDPPAGVVLVLRDISELKRLEQMRQQFIANVSHELKTPLSSIKAYTETLLGGARNDPAHCERFLRRIDEQASRLHELILDMLSLARIESSQALLEVVSVPVGRVVRRLLADYEPQAAARQVRLENLTTDDAPQVRADEEALRQVLSNLVDNAIKYTAPQGQVTIDCRREGPMVVIEVVDTGIGIAEEHHDRLFERFYRVDKARSRELGGTGLGLSIVKHLTQAMGGSVAVDSEVGRGSRFTVRLPLAGE